MGQLLGCDGPRPDARDDDAPAVRVSNAGAASLLADNTVAGVTGSAD
jgi:hypothetical protein